MRLTQKRQKLLMELEQIIGNECYNGKVQNWGPGGVFEGEGREFRYPITFKQGDDRIKRRGLYDDLDPSVAMTGYYGFGANHLYILRGLELALAHLERKYGLIIPR